MKQDGVDKSLIEKIFIPHRNELEKCIKPIHEARGVPNDYYVRPECFEMEGEQLFNKGYHQEMLLQMEKRGRILVRKSGTEPKIRIMAESYNKNLISKCIKIIKKSILS